MADTRKTVGVKAAAKAADTKTTEVKAATVVPATKEESATENKETAKKTTAKKETKKTPGRKPGTKKTTGRKTAAKAETEAEAIKETICLQYAGKSITTEELVNNAKNVWQYDLNQKVEDFKAVELYVKPEEGVVYYVINGDVTGNFGL